MPSALPHIIALCGNPDAGKDTAANILRDSFGYTHVDDGFPLRDFAMRHLGLTEFDVSTHEGKSNSILVAGQQMAVRAFLGELGKALEASFGSDFIPELAWLKMRQNPEKNYVLSSVRRNQTLFWAAKGALVLEIRRQSAPPSIYDFDQFNRNAVHGMVNNNGLENGLSKEDALALLKESLGFALRGL